MSQSIESKVNNTDHNRPHDHRQQRENTSQSRWRQRIFLKVVKLALKEEAEPRTKPAFIFELSTEAASHNFEILAAYKFDLDKIMNEDKRSILKPGSEFSLQKEHTHLS